MKTVYINEKRKLGKWKTKRIIRKLEKLNKKEEIVVAINDKLKYDDNFIYEIESRKIKILNGRWLFKLLIYDILEFASNNQNRKLEMANVAIVINNPDEIVVAQIAEVAEKVKSLKIITKNINRFEKIEEELYLKYGIAMQITNNKEKAMLNSDIIINVDEKNLEQYRISENATVVNIGYDIQLNNENFHGKVMNWYEIEYNKEIIEEFEERAYYNPNVIYESLIYKKDTFKHIKKQLEADRVRLINLY